jgi:hypothetical protein
MKRSLTIGLAALFLAGCGGGGSMSVPAGTGAGPNQTKSAVRAVRNVSKDYYYTLTVVPYPSGFNPPCQESNITIWGKVGSTAFSPNPFFELAGGEQPDINVGNCLAATGNSMHANLDVQYGNMRFIAGSGNFKLDSTDDSAALLTITDNTTGYSANVEVYLSY